MRFVETNKSNIYQHLRNAQKNAKPCRFRGSLFDVSAEGDTAKKREGLRMHESQRGQSMMRKRIFYASIPVLIFAGIVGAAYAFRSQKPIVEVAAAAKADPGGRQTLLNASGYVTPRRRATIAAKITG